MGVSGQQHTPATLYPWERLLHEAGWAPGPVWTGGKSSSHRDSIPNRPARSQSLYRLSYPAHAEIYCQYILTTTNVTQMCHNDILTCSYTPRGNTHCSRRLATSSHNFNLIVISYCCLNRPCIKETEAAKRKNEIEKKRENKKN